MLGWRLVKRKVSAQLRRTSDFLDDIRVAFARRWDAKKCIHSIPNALRLVVCVNGVKGRISTKDAFFKPLVEHRRVGIAAPWAVASLDGVDVGYTHRDGARRERQ